MKQVEKVCRSCGHKYTGAPQSKYCSITCRENGPKAPKFEPEVKLIKQEDVIIPVEQTAAPQRVRLSLRPQDTFMKDSVVHIQESHNRHGKLLTLEVLNGIKVGLATSETIQQVIANIAQKHKYKRPESYVKHIEEMLTLYDTQD